MPVTITALYAGILALIIVALGINVTVHRVKLKVSLGDGGGPQMLRMVRIHANACEYIPLALILMLASTAAGALPCTLLVSRWWPRDCYKPGACGRPTSPMRGAGSVRH